MARLASVAWSLPSWRASGVTKRIALCRCSPLYQLAKDLTQACASALVANPLVGQSGRYLQVLNSASEKGLSLLTRGRLYDAVMPSFSMVGFIVAPFMRCPAVICLQITRGGLPLSACRTSVRRVQPSASTACLIKTAAKSALSRSWTSQPTILRLKMSTIR